MKEKIQSLLRGIAGYPRKVWVKAALKILRPDIERWVRETAINLPASQKAAIAKKIGIPVHVLQMAEVAIEDYAIKQVERILD